MAILDKLRHVASHSARNGTEDPSSIEKGQTPVAYDIGISDNKEGTGFSAEKTSRSETHGEAEPSEDAQPGIRKIEAVTLAWSKKSLAGVLIL